VRDLEYDWQTLVENVADPSHVPFAHHGLQGNRDRAVPLALKIVHSTPDLIEAQIDRNLKTTITFEPPCRLEYAISFGGNKQVGLVTYCVPVAPGKSRIVAHFVRNFAKTLQAITPRWWDHLKVRNPVLDGDMIFLHQQERFLEQKFNQDWKSGYQLPTSADRLVIEFRKWFDKFCQGKLPWHQVGIVAPKYSEINESREALLDRYHQHTQHCRSCRNALNNVKRLEWGTLVYFAISIATTAVLPDSLRFQWGLPLTLVALLGLGVYGWLKFWLEPKFYFVDYVHAEK
jgi:phenylpropionate dioxygenase-like ring-hydroxylating dioxygenase large terminal subunit